MKLRFDGLFEVRLIVFDLEEIVSSLIHDLLAQIPLAEHGVACDNTSFQDHRLEQLQGSFVFVRLAVDLQLAERVARALIEQ